MDILARRRLLSMLRAKGRRKIILRKPGIIRYPAMIENQYAAKLKNFIIQIATEVRLNVVPKLDLIVLEANLNQPSPPPKLGKPGEVGNGGQIHGDAYPDRIEEVITYGKEMFYKIALPLAPIIEQAAESVVAWSANQLNRATTKALGAPLMIRDTFSKDIAAGFIQQNVALIKDISDETASKIQQAIYSGTRAGRSAQEIADRIFKDTGEGLGIMQKAHRRAERIARDQIGKLNGQLTRARQTAMGISRYRWRTMLDNRVRIEHIKREGRIFSWDKPPADGHPGEPPYCRCYAEPVFEDIIPELEG